MWKTRVLAILLTLVVTATQILGQTLAVCNVAMCIGSSPDVTNTDYTTLNVATNVFSGSVFNKHREIAFSAAIYSTVVNLRHRCDPTTNKVTSKKCVDNMFGAHRDQRSPDLSKCLTLICDKSRFYKSTKFGYRYDLVIVADTSSNDLVATTFWINRCWSKGFVILCVIVGTNVSATTEYEEYCTVVKRVSTYTGVTRSLMGMVDNTCQEQPVKTLEVCKKGVIHGSGVYRNHPRLCDSYVKCETDGGKIKSTVYRCGCGEYWNQALLNCRPMKSDNCKRDVCADYPEILNYRFSASCRGYWECRNQKTTRTVCCDMGEMYNVGLQQCVTDRHKTCHDECHCMDATTTTTTPTTTTTTAVKLTTTTTAVKMTTTTTAVKLTTPTTAVKLTTPTGDECRFVADKRDPRTYIYIQSDGLEIIRLCPYLREFNQKTCKCDIVLTAPPIYPGDTGCNKDFLLLYTKRRLVDSANQAYVENVAKSVKINKVGKYGVFSGSARLGVPRYTDYDWRLKFAFCVEFNDQNNSNIGESLLTNAGCGLPKSVEIRLDRNGVKPIVVASVVTAGGTVTVSAPYRIGENNIVYVTYYPRSFTIVVKYTDNTKARKKTPTKGLVLRRYCELSIGSGYTGRMYRNEVYIDCIPGSFL